MNVIVLGSGVIGTTTAWYLAQRGARVTVIDRQPGAALETSYANAGQVSPGYSTPWVSTVTDFITWGFLGLLVIMFLGWETISSTTSMPSCFARSSAARMMSVSVEPSQPNTR